MSWQHTATLIFLAPFGVLCLAFMAAEGVKIAAAIRAERQERRS